MRKPQLFHIEFATKPGEKNCRAVWLPERRECFNGPVELFPWFLAGVADECKEAGDTLQLSHVSFFN